MANVDKDPVANNNNDKHMVHNIIIIHYNFVLLLVLLLFLCFVLSDGVFSATPIYGIFLS